MAEALYLIKGETLTGIANALRSGLGDIGPIQGDDLEAKALEVVAMIGTGGGGSSDDVRYVTFMSYDGAEELGKLPVAAGYDCPAPKFTATRESTAQYSYTQDGWSTTANGGLDSNALKEVNEDRTVYAHFKATVRTYTITYLDEDGSVLNTETLAYGTMPSYTPMKDGVTFDTWEPALTTVTGNASYTAKWTENITFAGGAWADIAAISESGQAAEYFAIGDTKTITADGISITLRVIGFDHDTLADGSGKAGMTIFAETALADTMTATDWASVANSMKTKIKPKLPSDLQAVIKPVLKKCDATTPLETVITPTEIAFDLFPLSWDELGIKRYSGRLSTESEWRNIIAELGTTYSYFTKFYHTTYMGPNVMPWKASTGSWFRQYFRLGTKPGISHTVSLNSSASKWGVLVAVTEEHPVLFAFCI